jgi:hypothetical protein
VNPTQPRARRRLPFGNRAELQLAALGAKKTHETARWAPRESCTLIPRSPTPPNQLRHLALDSNPAAIFCFFFFNRTAAIQSAIFLVVFCSIVPLLHRWRTPRSRRRRWCTARRSSRRRSSPPTRRATPSPSPSGPSFASSIPSKEHPRPRLSYRGLFC